MAVGCVSVPHSVELSGVASCCTSVSQFRYEYLAEGQQFITPISEASPAFRFASGMSHFSAFHLPPAGASGLVLSVDTYWAAASKERPQVFSPSVTFYDKNFQPLATKLLMLSYQGTASQEGGHWRSRVSTPVEAQYAVLYTEARRVGNTLAVSTDENSPGLLMIGRAFAYYSAGGPGQAKYPCGHLGQLALSVYR